MIKETVICDVCGAERGESNHWWTVQFDKMQGCMIRAWEVSNPNGEGIKHVCGQACAHKLLNEFFERRAA